MSEHAWTLAEIGAAFMEVFAGAGELYFPYEGCGVGVGYNQVESEEEGAEDTWFEMCEILEAMTDTYPKEVTR